MKQLTVQGESLEKASEKAAKDLGITPENLRCVKQLNNSFIFEVLKCPLRIEVDIARDGSKAFWKKLHFPIGSPPPPMNLQTLFAEFEAKGIRTGLKRDVITEEFLKIQNNPPSDLVASLHILVAEAQLPTSGAVGKFKWTFDTKIFDKEKFVYAKKNEIILKAPYVRQGADGVKVTGEVFDAPYEQAEKPNIASGLVQRAGKDGLEWVAKAFGKLYFDEKVRIRLDSSVIDEGDGLRGFYEMMPKTHLGAAISGADLIDAAQSANIRFGIRSVESLNAEIKAQKKWPAKILVAQGKLPVDGAAGEVKLLYKQPASDKLIDIEKAKAGLVFPGEVLVLINPPKEPENGQTISGEIMRGRPYQEIPIYPGRNTTQERLQQDVVIRAKIYGRAKLDKDRVSVEPAVEVSANKMEASLDLFPQKLLTFQDLSVVLKESDILFGFEKEKLEAELAVVHKNGFRIPKFTVARGKLPTLGQDAKVTLHFDKEHFLKKGMFQKKSSGVVFAAPNDLLGTKILAVPPEDGLNIFREKILADEKFSPKDIPFKVGDRILELRGGTEIDPKDPLRLDFRAATMGTVVYSEGNLDIKPVLEVDKTEVQAEFSFAGMSDFKTPITKEVIKKFAEAEGIRVELEWKEIENVLRMPRSEDGSLQKIVIAKSIPPKHGQNATLKYFVEFNGRPIEEYIHSKREEAPLFVDCVRAPDVLAEKTPAGPGEDGKNIFGSKITSEKGFDEPWVYSEGIDKSPDGLRLVCKSVAPGFLFVEKGKPIVRNTVKIAKDKMSATVSIYPTKNQRFQVKADRVLAMLHAAGVKQGIKTDAIQEAIEQSHSESKPKIDVVVAAGKMPTRGTEASFYMAVEHGDSVGVVREDGSIDFKGRSLYQNVRKGQILLVKRPATLGVDGYDVCGNTLTAHLGFDTKMDPGQGVERSANGLEYKAAIDGIVEILPKSIRVIPGLLIPEDVSFKTGNIDAGPVSVMVRGGVLPDFKVTGEREITVEKAVEACTIIGKEAVRVRGGIIGRDRGFVSAGGLIETLYISSGATVEAAEDIIVGSEILNSTVRTTGLLQCFTGAGTIVGGEITTFKGLKARNIGAHGSEKQTVVHLGRHFLKEREALKTIADLKLDHQIEEQTEKVTELTTELQKIYEQLPELSKTDVKAAQKLQDQYRGLFERRKMVLQQIEKIKAQKQSLLDEVPINTEAVVTVTELIHQGVAFIFKDVVWVLKEPLRAVEIRWNLSTSNLVARRI